MSSGIKVTIQSIWPASQGPQADFFLPAAFRSGMPQEAAPLAEVEERMDISTAEQAAPRGASSPVHQVGDACVDQCCSAPHRDQKAASAGKGQGLVSNFSHCLYKPSLAACGVHLLPFNQPETVPPESQHGADPASPTVAVSAVSSSFFQKSNDFAEARDISLLMACQASCSLWDRASEVICVTQESPGRKQLGALSSAGVLGTEPPPGCERHSLGLCDGTCASEPKLTGFEAKQMDFTARRGAHLRKGNSSQHQTGLLSNKRLT